MKKFKLLPTLIIFILIIIFITNCSQVDDSLDTIRKNGVLRVGCRSDVVGFGYLNPETNTYEGLEIEIAYEIASKIFNCSIEKAKNKVVFTPVTDSTRGTLLDNDEIDVVLATFTITEERKKNWNFSTPYYTDYVSFLISTDYNIMKSSDLEGKIIGVPSTSSTKDVVIKYLNEKNITATIQEFESFQNIKDALSSGEISAFALDHSVLESYTDNKTIFLDDRLEEQMFGAATKLENKDLANLVDEVIIQMISTYNLK